MQNGGFVRNDTFKETLKQKQQIFLIFNIIKAKQVIANK
jgi:hypothetical protein